MKNKTLQAAAVALGETEDGPCCGHFDEDGYCCMAGDARRVFRAMAEIGAPSLDQCEKLRRGELVLARPVKAGDGA